MKTLILSLLVLMSIPHHSGIGQGSIESVSKPTIRRQFRAQAIAQSADLNVLILGPESVQPGTLVKLDASQTRGDTFSWKLAGGNPEQYDVSDDGRKVYFASPNPGTYSFILAVAKANDGKAPFLVMAEHKIVIQGATKPVDPVNPDPVVNPTPTDPLDVGRFGISRYVRDLVKTLPEDKRKAASGFSANYTLVSSGLKNKTIVGFTSALAEAKTKNQTTAGTAIADWKDPVFVPLGNKLNELIKTQVLNVSDNDALVSLFSEIGLGFAAAIGN